MRDVFVARFVDACSTALGMVVGILIPVTIIFIFLAILGMFIQLKRKKK